MLLADLEDQMVGKLRRRDRPQVVVSTGECPYRADEMHRGGPVELQQTFAVVAAVIGVGVAGRGVHVAVRVDGHTARRPDRALLRRAAVRCHVERDLAAASFGQRNQPTVVRPTVAGIPAEPDIHAAVREREARALLEIQRVLAAARIGVDRDARDTRDGIQPDELVVDVSERILCGRYDIDRVRRAVNHGRRQDAERIDVTAAGLRGHIGHRGREVPLPQHMTVVRVECVHRVVLGRGVDPAVKHERLPVDGAVERGTPPRGATAAGPARRSHHRCVASSRRPSATSNPRTPPRRSTQARRRQQTTRTGGGDTWTQSVLLAPAGGGAGRHRQPRPAPAGRVNG